MSPTWLEISVCDAHAVAMCHSLCDGLHNGTSRGQTVRTVTSPPRVDLGKFSLLSDAMEQLAAVHELHDENKLDTMSE